LHYYPKGQHIFTVELHRPKKVAPRVRPAPGMYHILAPDFAITGVTVSLQDAVKFSRELPGGLVRYDPVGNQIRSVRQAGTQAPVKKVAEKEVPAQPEVKEEAAQPEQVEQEEKPAPKLNATEAGKKDGMRYGYQLVGQWYVKKNETKKAPKFNPLSSEKMMRDWTASAAKLGYKTSGEQATYAAAKRHALDEIFRKGTGTKLNWDSRTHLFWKSDLAASRGMLKAETYIARNSVRVVMVTAQLSLVTDIGRNSWCPLSSETRIDNSSIVTFVRAKKRRRDSRKFGRADGYRQGAV
jgi:hypothetical protein